MPPLQGADLGNCTRRSSTRRHWDSCHCVNPSEVNHVPRFDAESWCWVCKVRPGDLQDENSPQIILGDLRSCDVYLHLAYLYEL